MKIIKLSRSLTLRIQRKLKRLEAEETKKGGGNSEKTIKDAIDLLRAVNNLINSEPVKSLILASGRIRLSDSARFYLETDKGLPRVCYYTGGDETAPVEENDIGSIAHTLLRILAKKHILSVIKSITK